MVREGQSGKASPVPPSRPRQDKKQLLSMPRFPTPFRVSSALFYAFLTVRLCLIGKPLGNKCPRSLARGCDVWWWWVVPTPTRNPRHFWAYTNSPKKRRCFVGQILRKVLTKRQQSGKMSKNRQKRRENEEVRRCTQKTNQIE